MKESIQIYLIDQMCLAGCQHQLQSTHKKSQSYPRPLWNQHQFDSTKEKTLKDCLEIHLEFSSCTSDGDSYCQDNSLQFPDLHKQVLT